MAKMFLREDISVDSSLIARNMDPIDQLHDLLARSPRRSIGTLLKAAKAARKFAKKHKELGNFAMEAAGMYGRSLEDSDVDAPDSEGPLELLERTLTDWVAMDERDLQTDLLGGRDLEVSGVSERDYEHEIYHREDEESLEDYFGREYDEFGLEELD